jgi:rubrerythrin
LGFAATHFKTIRSLPEIRRRLGFCPHCGYDVRASPGRCPECGRPNEKS